MGDNARGRRCGSLPLPGSKYCLIHQHLQSYSKLRNGRFTKALGKFSETYRESLNDRELMDLREPLAVMDMLIQRLMERMSELDTADFRNRARTHFQTCKANFTAGNMDAVKIALDDLGELLRKGGEEDELSSKLLKSLQAFMRRVEGAWEIKLARRNAVNAKEVAAALGRMLAIVKTETSRDAYARCVERFHLEILEGAGSVALLSEKIPREVEVESTTTKKPDA